MKSLLKLTYQSLCLMMTVLAFSFAAQGVAVDEQMLDDPVQEARARILMQEIRCLVCQNQSIVDSNAELAQDLRGVVREQIAAGKDDSDVKAYLVDRYGDWVLLKPPFKGGTLFLWLSPILFLFMLAYVMISQRRTVARNTSQPQPLSAKEQAALKTLLDKEKPDSDFKEQEQGKTS